MNIKQQYQPLYDFLLENKNKKVGTILEEVTKLIECKSNYKTFINDSNGQVVAVFCYYHKHWEFVTTDKSCSVQVDNGLKVNKCEYGLKASSSTGLNTMCKAGTKAWTRLRKKVTTDLDSQLLQEISSGALEVENLGSYKEVRKQEITELEFNNNKLPEEYQYTLEEVKNILEK